MSNLTVYQFHFSVRKISKRFGFKEVSDDDEWSLYWTDYSVALERVMEMKKYQVGCFMTLPLYRDIIKIKACL
jgi:hypothetical protein